MYRRHRHGRTGRWPDRLPGILFSVFLLIISTLTTTLANTPQSQFHLGRIWLNPEYDGAEAWGSAIQYPGGILKQDNYPDTGICRNWVNHSRKFGTYLMNTDWRDPDGTLWSNVSSYMFRSYNYDYPPEFTSNPPSGQWNYVYPIGVQEYLRYERPRVVVYLPSGMTEVSFFPGESGDLVFADNKGLGPRPLPVIDPTLVTEEVIESRWRYIPGVEYLRTMYGYPYGSPHQDYVLQDITLTNNGISGRTETSPVLTDQSISNMIWAQAFDYRTGAAETTYQNGMDTDAMYVEPWGAGNHTAILFRDNDSDEVSGPDWGDPSENSHYHNHLLANAHILIGCIFASAGPGAQYDTDDPEQPAFRTVWYERGFDFATRTYSPADPAEQREMLTDGGLQMEPGVNYLDYPALAPVATETPGPVSIMGYGPLAGALNTDNVNNHGWDLGWNESVRIVQVVAGGGVSEEEELRIGQAWNQAKYAGTDPAMWMSANDIALVQSGRDTAMKAAALAYWNFHGAFPANVTTTELDAWGIGDMVTTKPGSYTAFDVPEAPRPPGGIYVRTVEDVGVEVRWTREAESLPDHDTGVNDFLQYRVWKQSGSLNSPWELVGEWTPSTARPAIPVTQLPSSIEIQSALNMRDGFSSTQPGRQARTAGFELVDAEGGLPAGVVFVDRDVTQSETYWYAVTCVDDGTQNWARPGKALESCRWWTWTGYAYEGVPGPYVIPEPTYVEGMIGTATWYPAGNPYHITGACTVAVGQTLTIQPDVDVYFDTTAPFRVEGKLSIPGTSSGRIRFMQGDTTWGGLHLVGDTGSMLSYVQIKGAAVEGDNSGGVLISGTNAEFSNCYICYNTTDGDGGGVYVRNGSAKFIDCRIEENSAEGSGGGICVDSADVEFCGGMILDNTAGESGGGIAVRDSGDVDIKDMYLCGNSAVTSGGAAFVQESDLALTRCLMSRNSSADGGVIFVSDEATADLTSCTVVENTSTSHGGALYVVSDAVAHVLNSIFWDNSPPEEIYAETDAIVSVTYSDIDGGFAGEGNIDADPRFVYPAGLNYELQANSPCVDTGDPSMPPDPDVSPPDMGAFPCMQPLPGDINLLVSDVAKDQGGRVLVHWTASRLDTSANTVPYYSVWRCVPLDAVGEGFMRTASFMPGVAWEWLANVPAHQMSRYAYTAETFFDRTATDDAVHFFMVSVHTTDPDVYYDSEIVAGFSVDNLAPVSPRVVPGMPILDGGIKVAWTTGDTDVARYKVYRDTRQVPDINTATLLMTVTDTVFIDMDQPTTDTYYFICAEDIHGNVGSPVMVLYELPVGVNELPLPTEFALYQNAPNPFNPVTRINFDLPEACHVRLAVYNTSGQCVRVLSEGASPAGRFDVVWNGRDENGRDLSSGVYIYRLSAGSRVFTKRMTLVR